MPSSSALSSPRSWNILAASVLLMLSGWTLGTELTARNFLFHPLGSLPAEGPGSEGVRFHGIGHGFLKILI